MEISYLITAAVGVAVGMASGLLGVGGGTVMMPIFCIGFSMATMTATATSLFAIIPTSISGVFAHMRGKTCAPKVGVAMGIGGACGSPIGVLLAQYSPEWLVLVAVALIILYSAATTLKKAMAAPKAATPKATAPKATAPISVETTSLAVPPMTPKNIAISIAIGLVAGIAGGYVGLGGGFLMVPLMATFLNMPMKLSSGTSLIGVMFIAIPGALTQFMYGNVDIPVGLLIALGSIPGAVLGANLVRKLNERALRFGFAGFLLVASILMLVKQFA